MTCQRTKQKKTVPRAARENAPTAHKGEFEQWRNCGEKKRFPYRKELDRLSCKGGEMQREENFVHDDGMNPEKPPERPQRDTIIEGNDREGTPGKEKMHYQRRKTN